MGVSAALAVVSLASSAYAASEQKKAAKSQRRITEENKELARQETEEESRRLEKKQKSVLAEGRARAGATGLTMTGTQLAFLEGIETEQTKQLDWLKKAGASRADIEYETGMAQASITEGKSLSTLMGGIGTAAGQGAEAYWRT